MHRIMLVAGGFIPAILLLLSFQSLQAHHGVASLGVGGLEGPGAPVESSTSATLPKGSSLLYYKLDAARFATYTTGRDAETIENDFHMFGYGYGFSPWFSAYAFLPYNVKRKEDNSFNTAGAADLTLMAVAGFKYDGGFLLVPEKESLDDLEDWHFTLYGGMSLPTGNPNVRDVNGNINPSLSSGFGSSDYTAGATATKEVGRWTFVQDASYITFDPYTYGDGLRGRFGSEGRYNVAVTYRLFTNGASRFRFDPSLELNWVKLGRDSSRGISERDRVDWMASVLGLPLPANRNYPNLDQTTPPWRLSQSISQTVASSSVPVVDPVSVYSTASGTALEPSGGRVLYLLPGFRIYKNNISIAAGVKLPVWIRLNEVPADRLYLAALMRGGDPLDAWWQHVRNPEWDQQGSEGRERYRIIFSVSILL